MEEKPPKKKHVPFPKTPRNGQKPPMIDRAKMRDLYVNGPNYDWVGFCRMHGYPESMGSRQQVFLKYDETWSDWKTAWQQARIVDYDEELTPQLMNTTLLVTKQRIGFVNDWIKRTNYMKTLFDSMIQAKGDALKREMNDPLVRSGARPMVNPITDDEMASFSSTALKLQELETRSLLVVVDPAKMKALEVQAKQEEDTVPEIEIVTMGKTMSGDETVKMMASFFDQFEAKPQIAIEAHITPEVPLEKETEV